MKPIQKTCKYISFGNISKYIHNYFSYVRNKNEDLEFERIFLIV